jgi:predicted ester cyclase
MEAGDYEAVFQFFSDDFYSHVAGRVTPDADRNQDIRLHEKEFWEQYKGAFPDGKMTINVLIESDDMVVSNWSLIGTHTGGYYYDVPPSGELTTINGTAIVRFKDGKIIEHWGGPHCQKGIGLLPLN